MFEFTIKNADILNKFTAKTREYINKTYKHTMGYLADGNVCRFTDNERLILIAINKSVYQNLYSFLHLNDSNMQFAAFSCLETAVYAMKLYAVLAENPEYLQDYADNPDFSLEECEAALSKDEEEEEYDENTEQFSLKEFYNSLHIINTFGEKKYSIFPQVNGGSIYLGLSSGDVLSEELENEVRKNIIGAYLSLSKHVEIFSKSVSDKKIEKLEREIYELFIEYLKKYS